MRERKRSLTFFLMALFITGSLPITNSVSAEDEVDNWPENDAWLHIELISWSANETVEWDNNGGLPDPIFKICIEADGDNLDCINTPTWENQMTLNNSWNYSLDIPDHSNILNITIECEDNDAFNDDECDMNSELNEWKLYAEYNWSATPTLTVSGNGDGDGNDTWKNAASTWNFTIDGFGDADSDGVPDNLDLCAGTIIGEVLINNSTYIGCSWGQWDLDGDGIPSHDDANPFDANIADVVGGSREFVREGGQCRNLEPSGFEQWPSKNDMRDPIPLAMFVNRYVIEQNSLGGFCSFLGTDNSNSPPSNQLKENITKTTKFLDLGDETDIDLVSVDSLDWSTAQLTKSGSAVSHQLAPPGENGQCQTSISSLGPNSSTILTLNYSSQSSTERCYITQNQDYDLRPDEWNSHMGTFGDFDANGVIDFVHGVQGQCVLYLGISENPLIFHTAINLTGLENTCSMGAMASADLDNDGFDDFVTSGYIVFMSDSLSPVKVQLNKHNIGDGYYYSSIIDFENDGDLDVIHRKCSYDSQAVCYQNVFFNSWIPDEDSDGVKDSDDICLDTELDSIVDENGCSSSQKDTDNDGIMDDLDLCSDTLPVILGYAIDSNGCAEYQKDDDNDGINNVLDECMNTPEGDLVNVKGCSFEDSQDLDSDNDGVLDLYDACLNTPADVTVDSVGCDSEGNQTPDTDSDGDGVYDSLDDCVNTPFGATVDFTGCPMDSDFDGVYDGIDECPSSNNPSPSDMDKSSEVDSNGCFIDSAGSETNSGSAASGCLGMIVMIGLVVFVVRKVRSPKQEQVFYPQTQPVISPVHRQSVPIPQVSSVPTPQVSSRERQLEHQSRQAQIEAQRLRQQLAKQAQITQQLQSEAAQKQMSDAALAQKQHELAIAQREKEELEAKLAEAEKNTPIVQNITYNIQDSAISGDITNKINRNDLE